MARSVDDLVNEIIFFDPEGDDFTALEVLIEELRATDGSAAAIPSLFTVFERFSDADDSAFDAAATLIESHAGQFESALRGSFRRNPSLAAARMLTRLAEQGIEEIDGDSILEVLEDVSLQSGLPEALSLYLAPYRPARTHAPIVTTTVEDDDEAPSFLADGAGTGASALEDEAYDEYAAATNETEGESDAGTAPVAAAKPSAPATDDDGDDENDDFKGGQLTPLPRAVEPPLDRWPTAPAPEVTSNDRSLLDDDWEAPSVTPVTAVAPLPAKKAPAKKAPVAKAPVKAAAPVKKAPAKKAPAKKAPPKKAPAKKAPPKKAPAKKAPPKKAPPKKAPPKKAPPKKAPPKKAPPKKAPPKKAPPKKAAAKKAPPKKAAAKKAPPKKAPAKKPAKKSGKK